jgi:ATP-dependent DNA helicase DinG
VPFLREYFAPNIKVSYMKGRNNFLCRQKLYDLETQPVLKGLDEVDQLARIREWERETETGDRAELAELPDESDLWPKLDARRDTCTGKKCPQFERCFLTLMHRRALESDIVIVNHHLFFADLAVRQDDFGGIIPDYSAIIFDEAHEIEDVASQYFGIEVSNYRMEELVRDSEHTLKLKALINEALLRVLHSLRDRSRAFFELFADREGRFAFEERDEFLDRHHDAYHALLHALRRLGSELAGLAEKPEEVFRLIERCRELRDELEFLLESKERNYVYWFERRGRGLFLQATPIDVSEILREKLFERFDTILLTSATLAVGGKFDFLKSRLGLRLAREYVLSSHFDFRQQAILYVPSELPDVRHPAFAERATAEIVRLLEISRGRAFVLFTSHQQMNELYRRVRPEVDFPLLLQGSAPKHRLLERFRKTPHAVLFATSSFWQGVDVQGPQLSCVIIDRLPFAVPTDPVVAARIRAIADEGRNAFVEYQIPEAVLALKQGFGRLIRAQTDRGILAVLDNRIQRMHYGKIFLESLPDYRITSHLADVKKFIQAT